MHPSPTAKRVGLLLAVVFIFVPALAWLLEILTPLNFLSSHNKELLTAYVQTTVPIGIIIVLGILGVKGLRSNVDD